MGLKGVACAGEGMVASDGPGDVGGVDGLGEEGLAFGEVVNLGKGREGGENVVFGEFECHFGLVLPLAASVKGAGDVDGVVVKHQAVELRHASGQHCLWLLPPVAQGCIRAVCVRVQPTAAGVLTQLYTVCNMVVLALSLGAITATCAGVRSRSCIDTSNAIRTVNIYYSDIYGILISIM